MKAGRFFIVIVWVLMVTGCGRKIVPVSSVSESTVKKDSTNVHTNDVRTDSSYVETVTEKTLPASNVGVIFTRDQLDSLVQSLQQLPASVRTIYKTDPTMQTTIKIMMDSIGRLHFLCTTNERTYWERDVQQNKLIQSLTTELARVNQQKDTSKNTVEMEKPNRFREWWNQVKGVINTILLLVVLALALFIVSKFKK